MTPETETNAVVPCPKCRSVMWRNSSACQRCRNAAELVIPAAELHSELGDMDDDPPPYRPKQKRLRGGLDK